MSNVHIFYLLAILGVLAHVLGKMWQRQGTVSEWFKDKYNIRYCIATLVATVVFVLIGPGDEMELGSMYARGFAFTAAATGCEAIRVAMLGPARTSERQKAG